MAAASPSPAQGVVWPSSHVFMSLWLPRRNAAYLICGGGHLPCWPGIPFRGGGTRAPERPGTCSGVMAVVPRNGEGKAWVKCPGTPEPIGGAGHGTPDREW